MSRFHTSNSTATVYSLLLVCLLLSISLGSLPSITEAKIPNFSAIQESLVHRSLADDLALRRTLREVPRGRRRPVPAPPRAVGFPPRG
ncbi:hypothetical protein OWV82_016460 [Melia azedarach]|uniref:Uncharacterized protein n=1 Tax=Melia azedarach TaxID=155640 RepID=A0ACC1XH61_MELAZ|nr:hypothetical protein OWV82_016460 [Melia azedarach]